MAHLVMLFAKPRARVLVIGLGTGTTLGTLLRYDVRTVDVAEIAPGIVRAAKTHFARANGHALGDRRVRLHEADGRNFLLLEDRRWDAIQAEISSIWFAGAADLFNVELFRLARKRLAPGGVFEVWIQLHHIEPESIMMAIGAMRNAFPHTTLWLAEYQGLLIGSDRPLGADFARVLANESRPEVAETLRRVPLESLFTLFGQEIAGPDAPMRYRRLLERAGLPAYSTDDNLRLEFDTPKGNVLGWNLEENVHVLRSFARPRPPPVVGVPSVAMARLVLGYARFGAHRPSEAVRLFEEVRTSFAGTDAAARASRALERIRTRRTVVR
jgi:spermidine synthase